jgi:hypothetical protein
MDCANRRLSAPVGNAEGNGGTKDKSRSQPHQKGNKGAVSRTHQPTEN